MMRTLVTCVVAAAGSAHADFVEYMPGDLGPAIVDEAVTGGADLNANNPVAPFLAWEVRDLWNVGDDVTITGFALPLWANSTNAMNNTLNGTFTISFYSYGGGSDANVYEGSAAETLLGSATVDFNSQNTGVAVFGALFDSAINFTADATGLVFRVESSAVWRMKRGPSPSNFRQIRYDTGAYAGGGTPLYGNFTLLGTAIPAPASAGLLALGASSAIRRRR